MINLPILIDCKSDSYNAILIIVDQLTTMVYYKVVKTTIDALGLAEVIIEVVVKHYGFLESIISDRDSLFNSKF